MSDKNSQAAILFLEGLRQSNSLGILRHQVVAGVAEMELPLAAHLMCDLRTGEIARGAIVTLLDTCCGGASRSHPDVGARTVTLELRVDHIRPAYQTLYARAETYAVSGGCAFLRAVAHEGDASNPVAVATASFVTAS